MAGISSAGGRLPWPPARVVPDVAVDAWALTAVHAAKSLPKGQITNNIKRHHFKGLADIEAALSLSTVPNHTHKFIHGLGYQSLLLAQRPI